MATATQKKKVHKVMHEHKKGTLKSGSGKKVQPEAGGRHCHVRIRPIEEGELTTRHARGAAQAAGIVYAGDLGFSTCQTGGMA